MEDTVRPESDFLRQYAQRVSPTDPKLQLGYFSESKRVKS